jgi:hypothetical protein
MHVLTRVWNHEAPITFSILAALCVGRDDGE